MSKIEDLEKLQHLKETGVLTNEEFENEKKQILSESYNKVNEQQPIGKGQGKVIIHNYKEFYVINPSVKVYIDGNLITSLSKGQDYEYPISKTTTITFQVGFRTATATVSPNAVTEIRLIWNRKTGILETVCNEQNFNGINNNTNQQNYQEKLNIKKHSSNVWLLIGVIRRNYTFFNRPFVSQLVTLKISKKLFYSNVSNNQNKSLVFLLGLYFDLNFIVHLSEKKQSLCEVLLLLFYSKLNCDLEYTLLL